MGEEYNDDAVLVSNLSYHYQMSPYYSIEDVSMNVPRGAKLLLIGANGAGKTTLLHVLGGKYMVHKEKVRVLEAPPFHETTLASSGDLAFLGTTWRRANGSAVAGDVTARKMLYNVEGIDEARRQRLIELLDIDLDWSMMHVSDGQRRRVQIALGLLRPFQVLLLDEITVDLDVVGRMDLLGFLDEECRERKCTVIYATHIFDGLEGWVSHVAYVEHGQLKHFTVEDMSGAANGGKLLDRVETWLTAEKEERKKTDGKVKMRKVEGSQKMTATISSKHMSYFR